MNELELYYSNLYDGRNSADTQAISSFLNDLTDVPFLAKEKRNVCECSKPLLSGHRTELTIVVLGLVMPLNYIL